MKHNRHNAATVHSRIVGAATNRIAIGSIPKGIYDLELNLTITSQNSVAFSLAAGIAHTADATADAIARSMPFIRTSDTTLDNIPSTSYLLAGSFTIFTRIYAPLVTLDATSWIVMNLTGVAAGNVDVLCGARWIEPNE